MRLPQWDSPTAPRDDETPDGGLVGLSYHGSRKTYHGNSKTNLGSRNYKNNASIRSNRGVVFCWPKLISLGGPWQRLPDARPKRGFRRA